MDDLDLIIDLHADGPRQGPGGDAETRLAIRLSGLTASANLRIADIGCGTGAVARTLTAALDATVVAVDCVPAFLDRLAACSQTGADQTGAGRIETVEASMDALPFEDGAFDAIWSEGAIYNMGFEAGITAWRRHLKPGGVLAVSELTWFTGDRPPELERHWLEQYSEVATASAKLAALEASGYAPLGYFPLPEHCWLDNYYRPMQARFGQFLARNGDSEAARALVAAEEAEIDLYERYSAYFGYGYYVARRIAA